MSEEIRKEIMNLFLSIPQHNLGFPVQQWIKRGVAGFNEELKDLKWNYLDVEHGLHLIEELRTALDSEASMISKTKDVIDQIEFRMKKLKELEN